MTSSLSGSAVFHRALDKVYPTAVAGDGVFLCTRDGRKVFDGSSGAAVSCLGHGHPEVLDAICTQTRALAFAHSSFFTSDPAEALADTLLAQSTDAAGRPAFAKVLFLSSGSEAVESSLKLARQYHVYNGQPERVHMIGRRFAYHGNTLGALAVGDHPARRAAYTPLLGAPFHHVARCLYDVDGAPAGLSEAAYEDTLLAEYEALFARLGPATVAAVVVETVGGATLGAPTPTATYLPRLVALCHRHGALAIFDEVMCGMGRVGTYHAWQAFGGVAPDLQAIGKGLGAGYVPLSAVLVGSTVYDVFAQHAATDPFISGHTFQDHPIACAAALTVQNIVARDGLVAQCASRGTLLAQTLQAELPPAFFTAGGSLRGAGLFRTVDFGRLGAGTPLAPAVAKRTLDLGAAVYLCSGAVDAILLCPPFIMTATQTQELARYLIQGLKDELAARET